MSTIDHLDSNAFPTTSVHRVRRPVTRFVLMAAALCAVLLGVRWTGAFNPWVQIDGVVVATPSDDAPGSSERLQSASVVLTNLGALPLELGKVTVEGVDVSRVDGADRRLGPNETVEITVQFRSGCEITRSSRLQVEVETVLGRTDTIFSQQAIGEGQPTGNRYC